MRSSINTKEFSSKQENRIAEYLGWSAVSGSGSRPTLPGDIESDEWLGECKTHCSESNYIEFLKEHWDKISEEAIAKFKFAVLMTDNGTQDINKTWCIFNPTCIDHVVKIDVSDIVPKPTHRKFRCKLSQLEDVYSEIGSETIAIMQWAPMIKLAICPLHIFKEILVP